MLDYKYNILHKSILLNMEEMRIILADNLCFYIEIRLIIKRIKNILIKSIIIRKIQIIIFPIIISRIITNNRIYTGNIRN